MKAGDGGERKREKISRTFGDWTIQLAALAQSFPFLGGSCEKKKKSRGGARKRRGVRWMHEFTTMRSSSRLLHVFTYISHKLDEHPKI